MNFEILISTMFRTDLIFLENIFSNNNILDFNILIINQTDDSKLLSSDKKNIRVINSYERGTSASRNLAIKNALGNVCLFGDDDVVYEKDFQIKILNSFRNNPKAGIISFECCSEKGKPHTRYPVEGIHDKTTLKKIHTIVISFKKEILKSNDVFFNNYFSYNGLFSGGGEYVFLRNALQKKIEIRHVKQKIVMHPEESSGKFMESDENIYTRSAKNNHYYGSFLSYCWVFKYTFFLLRNKYIRLSEVTHKLSVGFSGVIKYNSLVSKGLIKRQK